MKKLFLILILLLFAGKTFSRSQGQMNRRLKEESVPKDILSDNYILVVKIPYDKKVWINKYTIIMTEHYKGKFEIVPFSKSIEGNLLSQLLIF
ncbi:hypothetical protein HNP38_000548 [Chryseobacterium defluvii]|uniref:Uncharacterized protein n=1 Tax=Chryseobacterium defluvii TaxID=160396 RepID=A0A840K7U0_9FLAO|nr:hypothetical protein [Chryseobacterium defluvii]MBB4805276.1 hypothetical protein [Chryseobacterium defluvii]